MKVLFILNDPPYGSERSYNALRLAINLSKANSEAETAVFLMADGVFCAKRGQTTPDGYYNVERMLKAVRRKGRVLLCGTCMDARGIADGDLTEGALRSSLDELTALTLEADKVFVF
jgi:uncharacterized protein involved in oxidation of intracellular sulfur